MADPAAPAASSGTAAAPARKQALKTGRDKCWSCGSVEGLEAIPVDRVEDAKLSLQLDRSAARTELPRKDNRLCAGCRSGLPDHRILGAEVAVRVRDRRGLQVFAKGTVKELAAPDAVAMDEQPLFDTSRLWNMEWSGAVKGPETLTTEAIGVAALDLGAVTRAEEAAVRALQREQAEGDPGAEDPATDETDRHRGRTPASPPAAGPAAAPAGSGEPVVGHRRRVRFPLPPGAVPGKETRITLPPNFLAGSPEQHFKVAVPASVAAGQMLVAELTVMAPARLPRPPDAPRGVTAPRRGRGAGPPKAAEQIDTVRKAVEAAGFTYEPQPNPLNPVVAWPIRLGLSFSVLQPGYFRLLERRKLFKSMFGFPTWDDAMFFFRVAFPSEDALEKQRAVLHPRFQYMAALWRMRADVYTSHLAAFFGVTDTVMKNYLNEWIPRLGMYAKSRLVYLPKPETICALMPQSFLDCKMEKVILVGDCKDHRVEHIRWSVVASADQHSSKSDAPVAMGQQWCTPIGHVAVATDLVFGRASEQSVSEVVGRLIFKDVPAQYSLAYDRGVAKLRLHLPNLNQVLTPCFLRGLAQFTVEQGIRNRGICCNRYIVEVVFARETAWKFLAAVCRHEDFHLLNWVWWWALGFQNLVYKPLKPPAK